jgi:hypothetical protein
VHLAKTVGGRIIIGLAATFLAATPAAAAPRNTTTLRKQTRASIGIRLIDVPVADRADPRAQIYIVDRLAPGAVIHRRIEIANSAPTPLQVALYSASASIANGSFLAAAGHAPDELSTWTSVRPGAVTIPADAHVTADVSVAVPRDAAPGERYGVIWAEARSMPAGGVGITQVDRVGIRLYVSVGPGGAPASSFAIDTLTAERAPNGLPMVLAAVHNTGGRALDLSGSLQLSKGPGRLSAGPFPATLGATLGVGDTEPVSIDVAAGVPAGPWHARVTLRSGLIEHTAQAVITFPTIGASAPVSTVSNGHAWPLLASVVIAALAALAVALAALRPRRARRASRTRSPGL